MTKKKGDYKYKTPEEMIANRGEYSMVVNAILKDKLDKRLIKGRIRFQRHRLGVWLTYYFTTAKTQFRAMDMKASAVKELQEEAQAESKQYECSRCNDKYIQKRPCPFCDEENVGAGWS